MKKVTITFSESENGASVEYEGCEKLAPDELANVMVPLLNDTLGDEPAMGDILAIQRGMMQAMN